MTEDEAKKKWCPQSRMTVSDADGNIDPHSPVLNRIEMKGKAAIPSAAKCIGSDCMAFRKNVTRKEIPFDDPNPAGVIIPSLGYRRKFIVTESVYCGAYGKPEPEEVGDDTGLAW